MATPDIPTVPPTVPVTTVPPTVPVTPVAQTVTPTPMDQFTQNANNYAQKANNYRAQGAQIDNELQNDPKFDYNQFYTDWKTGKKPVLDALMSNYTKPEQTITPEDAQKAKFGAALTDSLSSLAEIVANKSGDYVRNRGNEPTSSQTTNARLQAITDKYNQDTTQYNALRGNAEMQDFNQQLQQAMQSHGQQRQYLLYKTKQAQENAKEADKTAMDQQKNAADYALKLQEQGLQGKEFDEKMNEFKQKQGLDWYNAKTTRQKANSDKADKFTGLVINANPADNTAQTDATGARVVPYKMTKPEIDNLAMTAKNDQTKDAQGKTFMDRHPELLVDKPDMFGDMHKGLTKDEDIAWAYAQERYNKQYNNKFAPKKQSPQVAPAADWKIPVVKQAENRTTGNKYSF